jgi:hypothetical protein
LQQTAVGSFRQLSERQTVAVLDPDRSSLALREQHARFDRFPLYPRRMAIPVPARRLTDRGDERVAWSEHLQSVGSLLVISPEIDFGLSHSR